MRSLKLMAVILCLILIGILPKDSGHKNQSPIPSIITEAVSANSEFRPAVPIGASGDVVSPLALGEEIFIKHCSACHTTKFIWQSKILASEADSTVANMLGKDQSKLNLPQHKLLVEYLKSRLPKN